MNLSLTELLKEFDRKFAGFTIGILSGDKGSPVFANNDLEVPRFKNFITRAYELGVAEEEKRWMNQSGNEHDNKIREAERSRILQMLPEEGEGGGMASFAFNSAIRLLRERIEGEKI